jgi:DNA-binding beta-propeller fold protein YncE
MKRPLLFAAILISVGGALAAAQHSRQGGLGWDAGRMRFTLFNGWRLSPAGDRATLKGDMPGPIVFSPDGRFAVVGTSGFNDHVLSVVDLRTGEVTDAQKVDRSSFGLCIQGGQVFSSGGRSMGKAGMPDIRRWRLEEGRLQPLDPIMLDGVPGEDRFVTSLLPDGEGLLAANAQSNEVLRLDAEGKIVQRAKVGYRPRMIARSPDGLSLAVSDWGGSGVFILDSASLNVRRRFETLPHPTALAYHPDGRLFVAESGSNTVLQVKGSSVVRITVSVDPVHRVGPTPTSIAIGRDGRQMFVSLAGDNAVAVLDITGGRPVLKGHIPTERWPASVAIAPDGRLLAATAKGFYGPSALNGKAIPGADSAKGQMTARLAFIEIPDRAKLAAYTRSAHENFPKGVEAAALSPSQVKEALANMKKIRHVIYVIKENKTFDQVYGDLKGANGDPSLAIFGEAVTPNQHALARRFTIFDNLFADGESSQVGHQWTNSAYANEYTESQWSSNYGGKGQLDSDKRLTSSPGDYLWSQARKKGLKARVYGEYVDIQEGHGSLESAEVRADPEKWGYSEPWERVFARDGRDTEKLETFLAELKEFERTGKMPSLMVMALPDDHTHGYRAGAYSPKAMVGDNDLAVGRLVEAISSSRFWKETAIFIIQDDTQGGIDHVDSHRTCGLLITPWSQKGAVDSTHYTTASMLLTMEKILGLPPMSSYDAHATPMLRPFLGRPVLTPFKALPPCREINDRNPQNPELERLTAGLDWSDIDRLDPEKASRLFWRGERPGEPYPVLSR